MLRKGSATLSPTAPINPYAPNQVDESRRKVTYNLVIMDGKKDYLADRQEIRQEVRTAGLVPDEVKTCQIVVPTKSRMGEYIPGYDPAVAATTAGREAAQALKLLTCEFDDLVINSRLSWSGRLRSC